MTNKLAKIYQSNKTVFKIADLAILWEETSLNHLKSQMHYYVKKGDLLHLRRGVYAKKDFNPRELATSIFTPSYISLETVLAQDGMIFQYYETIFVMSYLSRNLLVGDVKMSFKRIQEEILTNPRGIDNSGPFAIASPERAFLDRLYLYPDYYFDNLHSLNWEKCFELVGIYKSQKLNKTLKKYYKLYAE